jgi:nucleotide-binding universal stress UspA family protein/uncharacterized protein (DUF302 family)
MFQRILFATDFSPASIPALEQSVKMAGRDEALLLIAHAYQEPGLAELSQAPARFYDEWNRELRERAERKLQPLVEHAREEGVEARALILMGFADEAIVEAAKDEDADLIVMGTHGRRGTARFFLGSVAARVISAAPCPVMTVRGASRESAGAERRVGSSHGGRMTSRRRAATRVGVLMAACVLGFVRRPSVPQTPNGLITTKSALSPDETMERLEAAIRGQGITVFARIDHSGGAAGVGMPLRFTQLLIFGNPKGGTPLMQSRQTIGIDLPLKFLVWQDERGDVWVGYDDPAYLAARHGITDRPDDVSVLATALEGMANSVATPGRPPSEG